MRLRKLLHYISKYDADSAWCALDLLNYYNIHSIPIDEAIPIVHQLLMDICDPEVLPKIMKKFMKHEVSRGRLTQEMMDAFVKTKFDYPN